MRNDHETRFKPGQRWASETEPELGLGIIRGAGNGSVTVDFPASSERRTYASGSAPLQRVRFQQGDMIAAAGVSEAEVQRAEEHDGIIVYHTTAGAIPEAGLSGSISHSKPEDRLRSARTDPPELFKLRAEALFRRAQMRRSPARGLTGARIDLLPHQLFIAAEVASRLRPRVLLADETGLGKTIEAGLILHRLHITGRAGRILILVPEPLIHQWFVELLRRFHLLVSIFDEERCASILRMDEEANPFLDSQLVLASTAWLARSPERSAEAIAAGWDLIIVDEAHHLEWTPEQASPEWELVQILAADTPGVLLLTATPQQLGPEGHFARLRLLDPDRYQDLAAWREETAHYEEVAEAVQRLGDGKPLSKDDRKLFTSRVPVLSALCDAVNAGEAGARERLIAAAVDAFGTGRVMFRNTRRNLSGFPQRLSMLEEVADDAGQLVWLASLLRSTAPDKILLICHSRENAEELHNQLREVITVDSTVFHEGMTLLQRDRAAAWFSEEDGARLLICSEIGSEGRNFQFAHRLVLWDLPDNPELLEQRIGRLDRIGQRSSIQLHIPWQPGTKSAVLAHWYLDGMDCFARNVPGAAEIAREVRAELNAALNGSMTADALIQRTREVRATVEQRLSRGHDRLLELSSSRPEYAARIIEQIITADGDAAFESFMVRLLDHFGMDVDDLTARSYLLRPGNLLTNSFPDIPEDGLSVTFDRTIALSREEWSFVTQDHPIVRSAFDALLGSPAGNASLAVWREAGAESLILECLFVVECIAPPALHADRFLPPVPVRTAFNHKLEDLSADKKLLKAKMDPAYVSIAAALTPIRERLMPAMLEKARNVAAARLASVKKAAADSARTHLQGEIDRLIALAELNDHVQPGEIEALREEQSALLAAIGASRLRLDAVRLIAAR